MKLVHGLIIIISLFSNLFSQTSLTYDGGDHLICDSATPGSTPSANLTISFWLRIDDGAVDHLIFSKDQDANDNYYCRYLASGRIQFTCEKGADNYYINAWANGKTQLENGSWHHIVWTVNAGTSVGLYLDSVKTTLDVGTTSATNATNTNTAKLRIGIVDILAEAQLKGAIDDLAFWVGSTATASDVHAIYLSPDLSNGVGSLSAPTYYWRFDEGTGQTTSATVGSGIFTLGATTAVDTDDPTWSSSSPAHLTLTVTETQDKGSKERKKRIERIRR